MTFWIELVMAGVVSGLVIGLTALSITLVFGIARFPNASAGDIMTAGAYGALWGQKATGLLILGGIAGASIGAALGLCAYWLVFRKLAGRAAVSLLVASIGIGFAIRAALGVVFGHSQQVFQLPLVRPWRIEGVRLHPHDLTLAAVALATLAVAFGVLYLTPIGRRMRAVADDPALARVSGISPQTVMIALWLMAGAIAGVAGGILGAKTVVSPEIGWDMLLPAFAAAILGGIGNPLGAALAGLLLGVAQELATPLVGFTYKLALSFLVMLAVLLVRPRGLFGRIEAVR
jgi:branched-chain amino acid transport system permease protein